MKLAAAPDLTARSPWRGQLLKENARLKKDLEQLKQLEIESEKRDNKLR